MLKLTRLNWLMVAGCSMVLVLAACGDKKSSGSKKPTPAEVAAGACNNQGGDNGTTCTGTDEYSECLQDKCDAQYKTCLGAGYEAGNYAGGTCETYFSCVSTSADPCKCTQDSACTDCFLTIATCAQSSACTLPTCTTNSAGTGGGAGTGNGGGAGTGAGGGKTCEDLEACCATLEDQLKQNCTQTASQFKALGAQAAVACSAAYDTYCPPGG